MWKKIWLGLKIALVVSKKLNDMGVIKVKELNNVPVNDIFVAIDQIREKK